MNKTIRRDLSALSAGLQAKGVSISPPNSAKPIEPHPPPNILYR